MTEFNTTHHGIEFTLDVERGDPGRPACDMYPAEPADDPDYGFEGATIEDVDAFMEWLSDIPADGLGRAWPRLVPEVGRVRVLTHPRKGVVLTKSYGLDLFDDFQPEISEAVDDWLQSSGDVD